MANKFYTVKKEIGGVEYVAQFSGISTALKAVDASYIEGTSNTSVEKLADYLFSNIIVEPKGLTADFATVFGRPYMTPLDVDEANVALDMQIEAERREAKRKR